ncbi:MAG: S9 family peptidase [Cellvibrio sp.]|uniref:alpha/beta hydrolase family protein n=1 Tax=Cellvibrio sp. TaxID=1965322 RepID=UPI0027254A18|nr:S9 family peptidase [Cellvibrio sp.]
MKNYLPLCVVFLLSFFYTSFSSAANLTTEDFSQLPDVSRLVLSPNGKKLAYTARISVGETQGIGVQVMDLATKEIKIALFTDNSEFFLNWLQWKDSKTILVGVFNPSERDTFVDGRRIRGKTRDTHLMIIDTEADKVTTPFSRSFLKRYKVLPSGLDYVVDSLPNDPEHILMLMPGTDRGYESYPLVYKVNIKKQKASVYHPSQTKVGDWVTDQQHNIRLGHAYDKDGTRSTRILDPDSGKWRELWPHTIFSQDKVEPLGFDSDPAVLYVRAYHQNRLAIFKVNLKDPELKRELVLADPAYDVKGHLIYSPLNNAVIGITSMEQGGTHFFDKKLQTLQAKIDKAIPGNRNYIYSISDDQQKFLVFSTSSTDSGTYYLGQTNPIKLDAVAYSYKKLVPELLSKTQRIEYKARDGLTIEAYLTTPKNKPAKNLPTLVFPHGGPIARDNDAFDYWAQFFVNKGYAVLQMNFRGSDGQGIELRNAGLKNWGKEMQDDVEDGARKLIADGIADPNAIAIVGASYGGYAALMGAVKTPDFYRCAISVNGVSNVFDLVKDNRAFWRSYNVIDEQIGNDNATLKSISPVNFADKIKAPVLLVHGTDDRQVEIKHSYQMRDALQKAKKDVTFVELPSEDHYLSNEKNRIDTFRAMDAFLNKCLPVKTEKSVAAH